MPYSGIDEFLKKIYKVNDYGTIDVDYLNQLDLRDELEQLIESVHGRECIKCGTDDATWYCKDCHDDAVAEAAAGEEDD